MTAKQSARTHTIAVKVPFHDLDPVGIVWHGHYTKYFEIARCALLETFDYNYDEMARSGYSWPIIDMHLRYVKAARFGETLNVQASLREWEYRLRIDYVASNAADGLRVCKGTSIQVAVDMRTREMCLKSPDILFQRLGLAVT
jgi:acyl-CoA thioester hydrolase